MTRKLSIPFVLLLLSGCRLQGSGISATETREVESFDKIDLGGAFDLVVHVDPTATQKVEVTTDDNIVPKVTTTVAGGELEVGLKDVSVPRTKIEIRVEVWVPSLLAVNASGASDIDIQGLHGESFELLLSGASDSTLQGTVERFDVNISGAAELDAKNLEASAVTLNLSGAGDAELSVEHSLDVTISGTGEVTYFGNPSTVMHQISGAGSLKQGS